MSAYIGNGCPPLAPGTELELTSISESDNKNTHKFTISKVCGRGGMSYVYMVEDSDAFWTLKEYCPKSIFADSDALCRDGNDIVVKPECRELYDIYMKNLIDASRYHSKYIKQNIDANISNIGTAGLFVGNNTTYIRSVYENGNSYDKIKDKDINFMFRIALATAKAVKQYHDNNILLIDIKPENILILKNNDGSYITDYIKFFDYDSMVTLDYARENPDKLIFSPNAPIEFKHRSFGMPDFSSDIFTIGAMIYKRINGHDHVTSIASGFGRYCDGRKGTLLYHAPASLISATNEFLSHTLLNNQKNRYQTIDEVIEKLSLLVNMSDEEYIYLKDKRQKPSEKFAGRKNELKEIRVRLERDRYIFLRGMGGVGKSELARKFAEEYKNEYLTCQFVSFDAGIKETIGALEFINLSEADYDGNSEELLKAKMDRLDFCDSKTLIIIDNIDVESDPDLDELLQNDRCRAKFIFTTRHAIANYSEQTYYVDGMDPEDCKELFFNCWTCTREQQKRFDSCIEQLARIYRGNALLIRLMADVAESSMGMCTPSDILELLKDGKYDSVDYEIGYHYKDLVSGGSENITVMKLLLKIFRIRKLDKLQFRILNNLSLVPEGGIEYSIFLEKSGFDGKKIGSVMLELARSGWIDIDKSAKWRISVHSLIADLVSLMYADILSGKSDEIFCEYDEYSNFLSSVCKYIGDDSLDKISEVRNRVAYARNLKRRCMIVFGDNEHSGFPVYQFDITAGRLLLSIRDYLGAAEHLHTAEKMMKHHDNIDPICRISTDILLCKALTACGNYDEAMMYTDRAVATAKQYNESCSAENSVSVPSLLIYKGEILDLKGLYDEAYNIYKEILDTQGFDEKNPTDSWDNELIPTALFHLGNSLSDKGDTGQAQKYLELELGYVTNMSHGSESETVAVTLAEIAENRLVSGDCVRALEDYSHAHSILCKCLGEDDPKTRSIYYARIGVLSLLGDTDEVIRESEAYVAHCKTLYGDNSVQTAYAYKLYSEMLLQAGKISKAGEMIEKSVSIYDMILPTDNPDYATALLNKAEYLYTVGRVSEAQDILDSLSDIRLVSLVDNAIFHANYISLLTLTGKYAGAEELCSEYIAVSKTNRLNQLHLINAYNLMGNIYLRSGRSRQALDMYGSGLELAQSMDFKGKINPNVWVCRSNMGAAYLNLGLFEKAYQELGESIAQLEKYYPEGHQSLVNIYINMGKCCFAKGEALKSLDWFSVAGETMRRLEISNAADIMLELNSSLVYDSLGYTDIAVEKCRHANDIAAKLWKESSANFQKAVIWADLGLFTAEQGDVDGGICKINDAISMLENDGGAMYYETAVMKKYLSDIYMHSGDCETAKKCVADALKIMLENCDKTDVRIVDFFGEYASVCMSADDYEGAGHAFINGLEFLSDAYKSLPAQDRSERLVMLLSGLGELYALIGDISTASFLVSGAWEILCGCCCENKLLSADVRTILGDISLFSNDNADAEKNYRQALDIFVNELTGNSGNAVSALHERLRLI